MFGLKKKKISLTKDEIAKLLNTNPKALEEFEKAYNSVAMESDNFFDINSRQAVEEHKNNLSQVNISNDLVERIVEELVNKTAIWNFNGTEINTNNLTLNKEISYITNGDLKDIPLEERPMLTGNLMKTDLEPGTTSSALLYNYKQYLDTKNKQFYHMFRQGLDILDLDALTYEILGTNPNAMGYWLPNIIDTVLQNGFFKVPKTTIIKVPLTLLQLTRLEYNSLNAITLKIVDEYCKKVFDLQLDGDYFIKTGTYSSKFDFRNVRVTTPKEVNELGEYLLFIHFQANMMAGPLSRPSIYGVSTTNEWVVRDFIEDKENNGCIYHGLPLHTEYRVFVDFDTNEVLGISPYWKPDVMKKKFDEGFENENADLMHDAIIYRSMEETLMRRYEENKDLIISKVLELLPNANLCGQWSIDIMQNGNDFWLIDMALAINSALNECVPTNKLKPIKENWLPKI